jgi:hypothetical protein
LFVFSVAVPHLVREDFFAFSLEQEEVAEMVLLFCVGLIGLILFNWKDIEAQKSSREKLVCARKASDAQRDLASSYAYIGATNRKIDILKEIILTVPQNMYSSKDTKKGDGRSPYAPILEAIRLFADCGDVLVGFYRITPRPRVFFEVASRNGFMPNVPRQECFFCKHVGYVAKNGFAIIRTGRSIQGVSAYAIIRRNHIKSQDVDLIKALLVQAIFLCISLDSRKVAAH